MMARDLWGAEEDDGAVEKARPLLAKMLALCEELDDVASEVCDVDLSQALTCLDVENWLIDALAATRAYEKMRDAQIDESNGRSAR